MKRKTSNPSASEDPKKSKAEDNFELILINCDLWTGEQSIENEKRNAIAMKNDRIVCVGSNEQVLALKTEHTKIIDIKHKFVMPGFIDSHLHFLMGGERLNSVDLKDVKSKNEFVSKIEKYASNLPKGQWITGFKKIKSEEIGIIKIGDLKFLCRLDL